MEGGEFTAHDFAFRAPREITAQDFAFPRRHGRSPRMTSRSRDPLAPTSPRIRLRPKAGFGGQERGEVKTDRAGTPIRLRV